MDVKNDVKNTVFEVLSEISGVDKENIDLKMDLVADLGIDSPKALRLLVRLEDSLGLEIPDEAAAEMDTVEDVLGWVKSRPA